MLPPPELSPNSFPVPLIQLEVLLLELPVLPSTNLTCDADCATK